ncbi:hypothetical protein DUNSADRAFT_10923 [Dunaliella salina]|uniref:Uncharacterized protein n=1 Tax=Dunaliella salina TaxID=3046 RepID=A0ABQ7GEH0_DUNSA|nr:hypothetical protein DUNSADRAFT_10923 [Dunaliella salina]|eukprot:KAF5833002.1 hypothetical protein DUNSADRAFT_10923 [Dunaliella salina]
MGFDKQDGAIRQPKRDTIIAVDFGTHGSGFAYAVQRRQTRMHESFPDAELCFPYPKTRTALLYTKDRSVKSWGHTAYKDFLGGAPDSLGNENAYIARSAVQPCILEPFAASNCLLVAQVVADYLVKLYRYMMTAIRTIWKDSSKALMRKAAQRAGLIRTEDSDQLALITEPEAAALHALKNRFPPLNPGEIIQIIDAGGGTVDISVHKCVERSSGHVVLDEAIYATGAMCGSMCIDDAFKEFYKEAVGHIAFDSWIHDHPVQWQQVLKQFEACKRSFAGDESSSNSSSSTVSIKTPKSRVVIPPDLHARMSDVQKEQLQFNQGTASDVVLDEKMEDFFDHTIKETISMASAKLLELAPLHRCSRVLLVGGLASSPYLMNCIRGALIEDLNVADNLTVPLRPYASVLSGAVAYGCEPDLIHARRSRLSYGVRLHSPWEDGAPKASKYWYDGNASNPSFMNLQSYF